MIDISMLKHFIAVVEQGGFTKAAEKLRTDVSSVSRSVKRLEAALSAKLIERTTRVLRLTPAGTAYYHEARFIVGRLAEAGDKVRRIGEGEVSTVRIGVCQSVDAPRVARALQAFGALWPEIEVKLCSMGSLNQAKALQAGEIDAGIMRPGLAEVDGIDCSVVSRDQLMLAVPTAWKLPRRRVELEELCERPWILPDPELAPRTYQQLYALFAPAGFNPRIAAVIQDGPTLSLLLSCGVGAAFTLAPSNGLQGCDIVRVEGLADTFASPCGIAWGHASNAHYRPDLERCLRDAMSAAGAGATVN